MNENIKKPPLRFKGFTEAWEQRELIQIANYRNGRAHENAISEDGKYIVINSKFVSTNGEVIKFSNLQIEPLWKNEIAFVLSDVPNGRAIARTFLVENNDKYTLNQRIAGITPLEKTNSYFLYIIMNRNPYFLQFDDGAKQTNLSKDDVTKFSTFYPILNEQEKIGTLFSNLNNLITLHQRKYDRLVNIKKGFLEKMFPQNGSSIPEIRFKGFTEAWEQRKLGDVFDYERPDKYIVKSDKYSDSNSTPVLTANKGFILGYTNETNTYKNNCIIFDDFTLDRKYINFPFMVKSSAIKLLTTKNENILEFSYELLNATKLETLGHARHYISIVQNTEVFIPKPNEQTKVADVFSNLDNLITLHQRKLEKLKNIKTACLEKMFV